MKTAFLSMEQIYDLDRKDLLFLDLSEASHIAQRENMAYRTDTFTVVHVIHKWTEEDYGYAVLQRI